MPHTAIVIEPGRVQRDYWRELWAYRELFVILAWRDVAVRYKQTLMGVAWALLRPFLTMVVFTVVFGGIAKLPSDGQAPYALMVLAGMLPWYLFSSAVSGASDSMLSNANLIGKVYFPRIILPCAAIVGALVEFAIGLFMLASLMAWYRFAPGWHLALLPLFALLAVAATVGPGLWLAALSARYRDFRYVVPFLLQVGIYISPVGFSSRAIPEQWRLLYSLNPMAGVIDGFRWCIIGGSSPVYLPGFLLSVVIVLVVLWLGLSRFRRAEASLADVI